MQDYLLSKLSFLMNLDICASSFILFSNVKTSFGLEKGSGSRQSDLQQTHFRNIAQLIKHDTHDRHFVLFFLFYAPRHSFHNSSFPCIETRSTQTHSFCFIITKRTNTERLGNIIQSILINSTSHSEKKSFYDAIYETLHKTKLREFIIAMILISQFYPCTNLFSLTLDQEHQPWFNHWKLLSVIELFKTVERGLVRGSI